MKKISNIITDPAVPKIIIEHLDLAYEFAQGIKEGKELIPQSKLDLHLSHIELNLDISWFMITHYINLKNPDKVRDIFSNHLSIRSQLKSLKEKPTIVAANTLIFEYKALKDKITS